MYDRNILSCNANNYTGLHDCTIVAREDPREWKWMFQGCDNGNSIVNSPIKIIPTLSTIDEYSKNDYNFHHLE